MSLLTTINWLTDLLLKSETTKTTMTWIAEPESWQWGEVIYNQIVTWTAFVILVMFILICGSNFLAVSLIMIFLMTIFEILVHIGLMAFLWRCNFFIGGEGQEDLWALTQERKTFFLQRLFSCVTTRAQWVLDTRLLPDIFFITDPIQFWKSLGTG